MESLLSTYRTPVTAAAAREALSLLSWSLPAAYDKGDLDARYGTALRACQAGLALNASVVLGHSLAYAIATRTGLPHGVTVAMALPYCLAHARQAVTRSPRWLRSCAESPTPSSPSAGSSNTVGGWRSPLARGARRTREALPAMAADCVDNSPSNHPTPIDLPGVLALLERMHAGGPIAAWHDSVRLIDSEAHA